MLHEYVDAAAADLAESLTADSVVVLPIGAIEQHGPHLPLATDFYTADAIARAAAQECTADIWMLPALAYGKSDEHADFPGTIWLSWQTTMELVIDIGRSVAATPARRFAFFNGHGGNSALLQVACRELRRRFDLRTFVLHGALPADQGGGSDADEHGAGVHAGRRETSVMLHLRPDLVRMELARRRVPEGLDQYRQIGFGKPVSFGWLSSDFGPSGVIGDPTGATAEEGKRLFEAQVGVAADALDEVAVFVP